MEGFTEVFVWGGDRFGQLGLSGKQAGEKHCHPRFCSFNVIIKQIGCGEDHAGFIADNGCVYTMGSNADGRLGIGDGSFRQSSSPCLVESLVNYQATAINCGWGHTAVILEDGSLYTWGVGEFGALGLGSTETRWSPTRVPLPRETRVTHVSCGARHTAIITEDPRLKGRLYMFGAGETGQLGTGLKERELLPVNVTCNEELKGISCGTLHTACLTVSGRLLVMGGNNFGQLGLGSRKSVSVPTRVTALEGVPIVKVVCGHHTTALSDDGELFIWGTGTFGEFTTPMRVTSIAAPVKDIDAGGFFGAAVDVYGVVWTWGSNDNGELGVGDYEPRTSPFPVKALQGKIVRAVSCGGGFAIALGNDVEPKLPQSMTFHKSADWERVSRKSPDLRLRSPNRASSPLIRAKRANYTKQPKVLQESSSIVRDGLRGVSRLSNMRSKQEQAKGIPWQGHDNVVSIHPEEESNLSAKKSPKTPRTPLSRSAKKPSSKSLRLASRTSDSGLDGLTQLLVTMQDQQAQLREEFNREQESRRNLENQLRSIHWSDPSSGGQDSKIRELEAELSKHRLTQLRGGELEAKVRDQEAEINRLREELVDKDRAMQANRLNHSRILESVAQDAKLMELEQTLGLEGARRRRAEEEAKILKEALDSMTKAAYSEGRLEARQKDEELRALRSEYEGLRASYEALAYQQRQTTSEVTAETEDRAKLSRQLLEAEKENQELVRARLQLVHECETQHEALQESKHENGQLQQQLSQLTATLDEMKMHMSTWQSKYSHVLDQNSELKGDMVEAELKNRQLFEAIEKDLMLRARDYKERTLNALGTPSPLKSLQASVAKPVKHQPVHNQNEAANKQTLSYHRHAVDRTSKSASKRGSDPSSIAQSGDVSPRLIERHKRLLDEGVSSPPTFREKEQDAEEPSFGDINDKLLRLQRSKLTVDNRMANYERQPRP